MITDTTSLGDILHQVQNGEISISKAKELIYDLDDHVFDVEEFNKAFPKAKGYFGEDEIPREVVKSLRSQLAEWEKLRDPEILHVNLLRGSPAQLTQKHCLHLAGNPPVMGTLSFEEGEEDEGKQGWYAYKPEEFFLDIELDKFKNLSVYFRHKPTRSEILKEDCVLSNDEIDIIVRNLPDGALGYMKTWGYQNLANALLDKIREKCTG